MTNLARRTILTAFLAICSSPLHAQPSAPLGLVPALPRPGAAMVLDNARGMVWDVISPPGLPTGMHRHGFDFVGVELVTTVLKVTTPDGKARIGPLPRGAIYMLPKGLTHSEEGIVGHPQRNTMLIALKDAPSPSYPNTTDRRAGFTAAGARKAVDNARVIAWDATWTPGAPAEVFFQSRDIFIVPMTEGTLSISSTDQPTQTLPLAAGQAVFLPGGHTREIRSVDGTLRAAVVELK
jgi:hypothetical protein